MFRKLCMVAGGLVFAALVVFGRDFADYLALPAERSIPAHTATADVIPTSFRDN